MTTAIKERPILFSDPMVRAILEGRKTQTRRIITEKRIDNTTLVSVSRVVGIPDCWYVDQRTPGDCFDIACKYGRVGDRLWVRETFWQVGERDVVYRADYLDDPHGPDGEKSSEGKYRHWKPSIFMPRWASRITLEITDVKAERLQDISESDAAAEGVSILGVGSGLKLRRHQRAFKILWCKINGQESWDANPWVWKLQFKVRGNG